MIIITAMPTMTAVMVNAHAMDNPIITSRSKINKHHILPSNTVALWECSCYYFEKLSLITICHNKRHHTCSEFIERTSKHTACCSISQIGRNNRITRYDSVKT